MTFTASATGGAISMREWLWTDSTGSSSAGCGTATTCKFVPPRDGEMVARARIGSSPWIEQASTSLEVLPIAIGVRALEDIVPTCEVARFKVKLTPNRGVSGLTIDGGSCSTLTMICSVVVNGPDTLSITATLDGTILMALRASLQTSFAPETPKRILFGTNLTCDVQVDTLPCKTNRSELDQVIVRRAIDSLWKLGGDKDSSGTTIPTGDRRERVAFIVDSAGVSVTRFISLRPDALPCETGRVDHIETELKGSNWVTGMMVKGVIHTHPFTAGEPFPPSCDPMGTLGAAEGPSHNDWQWLHRQTTTNSSWTDPDVTYYTVATDRVWTFKDPGQWTSLPPGVKFDGGTVLDTIWLPQDLKRNDKTHAWERRPPSKGILCFRVNRRIRPNFGGRI